MNDKSHVGMARCFYCGEPDKIILDRRLKASLPRDCGVIDMDPCNKCAEYMKQGIILIGVVSSLECKNINRDYEEWKRGSRKAPFIPNPHRSGAFAVVRAEAFERGMEAGPNRDNILKHRWTFMDMETWARMGIPVS